MPVSVPGLRRRLAPLIREVWRQNLRLQQAGLVTLTWGNVSGADRANGAVIIKPSGIDYAVLRPADMVVTDFDGRVLDSARRPSTDLPTHLELYRAFPDVGGVVHTHSPHATACAQAGWAVPCLGTTHADYTGGPVPVVPPLGARAIRTAYERETGRAIVRALRRQRRRPLDCPFALVTHHGPFAWGRTAAAAVEHAVALETICRMAILTRQLEPRCGAIPAALRRKHYARKHGRAAYYGQTHA